MIAIIPAAGLGTRFLPLTKSQPKEMLPVLNKPTIQYIVEEAVNAGADKVVVVNSRTKQAIENHFAASEDFEQKMREAGKTEYADAIADAASLPVEYAYQDEALGLGHAVLCADDFSDSEPFFVLLGDMLVPDGGVLERMREISEEHNGANVIAVFPAPEKEISRYGIVAGDAIAPDVWKVRALVEKPARKDAPSNLAIFGRYLLSPKTMQLLRNGKPGAGGEIQLTDALDELLQTEEMYALVIDPTQGFDTGTPAAWLETNIKMAMRDSELRSVVYSAIENQ